MARKTVERNIAFDEEKELFYITLDYGKDGVGKRIKKTKTSKTVKEARAIKSQFESDKIRGNLTDPNDTKFKEWLEYFMEVKGMKCEETTLYGYKKIIDTKISFEHKIFLEAMSPTYKVVFETLD